LLAPLATESKCQHLAPTVRATRKPPAIAPKRANPKADEAAKAALLAARKGKALALTQSTHQEVTEDDTLRTCGPEGQSQPPLGFAPLEGADLTEDGEVLGVSVEEQLQLRALRLKNRNLQRQKEILEAKRQRVSALAKVRQMIRDEEQKAQDLEREITLMQRDGHLGLQHEPPLQQRAQLEDTREGHLGLQHEPPLQQRAQPEGPCFP
jgi:phage tail tape-measure protein